MWFLAKVLLSASIMFTWFQTVRIPHPAAAAAAAAAAEPLQISSAKNDDNNNNYNCLVFKQQYLQPPSVSLVCYLGGTHAHEWLATGAYAACVLGVLCV